MALPVARKMELDSMGEVAVVLLRMMVAVVVEVVVVMLRMMVEVAVEVVVEAAEVRTKVEVGLEVHHTRAEVEQEALRRMTVVVAQAGAVVDCMKVEVAHKKVEEAERAEDTQQVVVPHTMVAVEVLHMKAVVEFDRRKVLPELEVVEHRF